MKGLFGMCVFLLCITYSNAQEINWLTWEEVSEKMHEEPRKVMVDVYTEWCGYCKKMDASTFKNKEIVEHINANYYAVKFDAEYKGSILLNGKEYKFIKAGRKGYHELAYKILKGSLKYPTLVFMDYNMKVIQPIPGYRDVKTLNMILDYYGGDHHKSTPWKTYTRTYKQKSKIISQPQKSLQIVPVGN